VEFAPTTAQQFAGLIVYSDDEHAVSLGLAFATGDRGDFRGIVLLSLGDDPESDAQTPGGRYDETNAEDPNSVYLRLLRKGDQFVGAFSPDGVSFKDIGTITNDLPDAISVGLGAANGDTPECGSACDESIPADYDFFQISTLDSDAAADDGASVEIGLESVEVTGPDQVSPGAMAEYVAQAVFSDGTASDVTDQAEWTLAPDGLGQVEAGQFTAASVEAVQQVTVVASFSQLTSGGEIIRTGTKLVRITSPPGGGGGGSSGGGLCGAGLVPFWLVTLMGFGQRKFWRRRR
ncbi:MAG: hypothetical protein ACE5GE_06715, partial [Phycisphaerae bacterium]